MPNKSQKFDTHRWETWKASGALGTSVEELERREQRGKKFLEQLVALDDSLIPREEVSRLMEQVRSTNEKNYKADLAGIPGHTHSKRNISLLRTHPKLTRQQIAMEHGWRDPTIPVGAELEDLGSANNIGDYFKCKQCVGSEVVPTMIRSIRDSLKKGVLPNGPQERFLFWLIKEGLLMQVFKQIGFQECQTFFEEDRYIREMAGYWWSTSVRNWSWVGSALPYEVDAATDIPPSEKRRYIDAFHRCENWKRKILVALYDKKVNFNALYGTGNPFV